MPPGTSRSRKATRTTASSPPEAILPLKLEGPRIRHALVQRARERVSRGYYDRADVTRALVEALLVELAPR